MNNWFAIVSISLIGGVFIYSAVKQIMASVKTLHNLPQLTKTWTLLLYAGILESVLTIIFTLFVAILVFYGCFEQKTLDEILKETLQLKYLKYIFIFLGIWLSVNFAYHFLRTYLQKDFRFINILHSFRMMFIGFGGLLFTTLGILIFVVGER